jgi:hypothetical protein
MLAGKHDCTEGRRMHAVHAPARSVRRLKPSLFWRSRLRRYVQALKEAAAGARSEAQREEYGGQAARLLGRTQALMQRWGAAFQARSASQFACMPASLKALLCMGVLYGSRCMPASFHPDLLHARAVHQRLGSHLHAPGAALPALLHAGLLSS